MYYFCTFVLSVVEFSPLGKLISINIIINIVKEITATGTRIYLL